MTPFESAYDEVAKLVNQFAEHEDQYLSHKYQESEVRGDFIDKFWKALGWDVNHKYQTNPREQEVKVEKNPDSNASGRKADYAFYLKPDYRNPIFFCEAKKPRHDLGSPEFYFQLVRYGRAAGTPVSVLFDFEEFHVVDCRYEANLQKSFPSAQIKAFRYKDYLDRDKFGDIYWLFSREAVEAGKLKEFAKSLPKQRGKGAAKLTADEAKPADEALLTKLEEYRLTLAKAFKKADESLDAETLTEATQKVIDRLVFIRFLEDKNIEADYIVDQIAAVSARHPERSEGSRPGKEQTKPSARSFAAAQDDAPKSRKTRTAWDSFIAWSKELDVKYNGVVFKPHEIDKPSFIPPDDKVFADICRDISFGHSKYIFSYIPIELIGSIYERFLGKVVTATAKRADIEYKPEVRKAGGVYYTPKYIVDYIVANTVGKILGSTPTSDVILSEAKDLAPDVADDSQAEILRSAQDDRKKLSPKEVSKLRFADIACGSGSFLIAVYDAVLHHVESWYNAHPEEARKAKCIEVDTGVFALSLRQKQQILLDNIYGVDIDPQAVEVAQLSLFLKLLEGESGATAGQMSFEKTKILPDLSKNIVCGNSLVDYDISDLFPLTPEEEERIKPFSFETTFRDIMRDSGFDAIVGNPPYVRIQTLMEASPSSVAYFKSRYRAATKGNYDIYVNFVERSWSLLRPSGHLGYILPNKFLRTDYGEGLRGVLSSEQALSTLVDFGSEQVFTATTYTCLLFLNKTKNTTVAFSTASASQESLQGAIFTSVPSKKLTSAVWTFASNNTSELLEKVRLGATRLLDLPADMSRGSSTGDDSVFVIEEGEADVEPDILRTPLYAQDFGRYSFRPSGKWSVIFPYVISAGSSRLLTESELKLQFPKAYTYLSANRGKLERRKQYSQWYGFSAPRNLELHQRAQIAIPLLASTGSFALLPDEAHSSLCPMASGGFTLALDTHAPSPAFVLGLLNSKLLFWVLGRASNVFRGGWITCTKQYFGELPIRVGHTSAIEEAVRQLTDVKQRLDAAKRDSERDQLQRKCEYLDAQIDRLVYELYGLTEDEIKIVEGR